MTYQTHISKGYDGWQATSEAVLGETDEGSVVTQMILLRETLKDAEAWFIFKKIPYSPSAMALLHEGIDSVYERNK